MTKDDNKNAINDLPMVDHHQVSEENQLPPAGIGENESFQEFEKRWFTQLRTVLKCPNRSIFNCDNIFLNSGVAGNKTQGGFQTMQFKCNGNTKQKGCGKKNGFPKLLELFPNLLETYRESLKIANERGLKKQTKGGLSQPKLNFTFGTKGLTIAKKRKADSSPLPEVELTQPTAALEQNDRVGRLETEVQTLKEQLQAVLDSNRKLMEKLTELLQPKEAENNEKKTKKIIENDKLKTTVPKRLLNRNEIIQKQNLQEKQQKKETNKETPKSYSSAVKANKPLIKLKTKRRLAKRLIDPVQEAQEFCKIHMKINNNRVLRKTDNNTGKRELLKMAFKELDIKNEITDFSKIGNSIVEIIALSKYSDVIMGTLRQHNLLIENYDPMVIPSWGNEEKAMSCLKKRLKSMYCRARTVEWRKTILQGIPEDIAREVVTMTTIKPTTSQSVLLQDADMNLDALCV